MEKEGWLLEKELRLRLLPDNPYFKEEVEKVCQQVGGFDEDLLFDRIKGWVLVEELFPLLKKELLEGRTSPSQWSRQWIDPEAMPVKVLLTYAYALQLMDRFYLPHRLSVFRIVVSYMAQGKFDAELGERPNIFLLEGDLTNPDDLYLLLNWRRGIAFEIDEYTTKKELHSLWETVVKIRDELRNETGIEPPYRRRRGEKWERQLNEWLRWYGLYKETGSIEKALTSWSFEQLGEEKNEEEVPSVEDFRYAVREIDKLMRPIF